MEKNSAVMSKYKGMEKKSVMLNLCEHYCWLSWPELLPGSWATLLGDINDAENPVYYHRHRVFFCKDLISEEGMEVAITFWQMPKKQLLFYHKAKRIPKLWLADWFWGRERIKLRVHHLAF